MTPRWWNGIHEDRQPNLPPLDRWSRHLDLRRLARTAALSALVVPLAACSFSFGDSFESAAVDVIEGDLTDRLELGELFEAECDEPTDEAVGSSFDCTAETESGTTVEFTANIVAEDEVSVIATNALAPDDFFDIEVRAPAELEAPGATVDCPSDAVVLADGEATSCEITDTDGVVYELLVSIDGAAQQVLYEVGDPIG